MKKSSALDNSFYYGATADIMRLAADLRKNMTAAEKLLWERIRVGKLGYKFRRQHPMLQFIADFYCHEKLLVIEVDGEIHNIDTNREHDEGRDFEMQQYDIKVLRFTNNEIFKDIERVIDTIRQELQNRN